MMKIQNRANNDLIPYLAAAGVSSTFPLYVSQQRPEAVSPCIVSDAGIDGCLVTGKYCGMEWVHSYWLACRSNAAASLLLQRLRDVEGNDAAVTFPLEYIDQAARLFPDKKITIDRLYVLNQSDFNERQSAHVISQMTEDLLCRIVISDEMRKLIGNNLRAYNGIPAFGIIIDNQLTTTGEALCDTGHYAAIQQVYTASAFRGHGLGSMMVSHIAKYLIDRNRVPVYWVSENNASSIRLVQKLGFELAIRMGCIDE